MQEKRKKRALSHMGRKFTGRKVEEGARGREKLDASILGNPS